MFRATIILGTCVCVLAGCGSSTSNDPATAPVMTGGSYSAPAVGYTTPPSKPWYRQGMHTTEFQSPTGNIICGPSTDRPTELLCKTKNNNAAVVLNQNGPIHTNWTVGFHGFHEPTLEYGHYWWSKSFYCWSMFTGVKCRSLYSTHGFLINRDGIEGYRWAKPVFTPTASSGGGGSYSTVPTPPPATSDSGDGDFCLTHDCIPNFDNGNGYPVECTDGTWSDSGGIQGACSDHGGEM